MNAQGKVQKKRWGIAHPLSGWEKEWGTRWWEKRGAQIVLCAFDKEKLLTASLLVKSTWWQCKGTGSELVYIL